MEWHWLQNIIRYHLYCCTDQYFDFTLETGKQIPIEERSADEVRLLHSVVTAPQQVNVFNPAFDVTPGELITGIITEYGVISAPYIENIKNCRKYCKRRTNINYGKYDS